MNEDNEDKGTINWAERHDVVAILRSVGPGKRQLRLGFFGNTDLVITLWGVEQPHPCAIAECQMNSRITARNGVRNDARDLIERNEINTEAPNKVIDVGDVLLMRFRCEQGFE